MTEKSQPILALLFFFWCSLAIGESRLFAQSWIVTNTVGPKRYPGEIDLTPSIKTNAIPNWASYYNHAARLLLRPGPGEDLVAIAKVSPKFGGPMVANYDVRTTGGIKTNRMTTDAERRLVWQTNRTVLKFGYFRGRIFYLSGDSVAEEWITVFTSEDRTRIVTVHDSGPIYISENTGYTWKAIFRPGTYEFILSSTPKGSAEVAVVSVADDLVNMNSITMHKMATKDWYSAASGADGNTLVLAGGPSQSVPALSISHSSDNTIISWPGSYPGLILQKTDDLATKNWINVTNRIEVIDKVNQVILPIRDDRVFFRLRRP